MAGLRADGFGDLLALQVHKDDWSFARASTTWPYTPARRQPPPPQRHTHTHDGRHRSQPRRRPCSLFRARQAVAAVAVEHPTPLELPTAREAEAPRPQRLEANLHRARPLDNRPEEMRSQLRAEQQWQMARASNHREAGEAHSEARLKPKAAGSSDSTRYVRPQHASTDGEHHSDFVPFSPIARNQSEARARRRNRQWNYCRPGQTEGALAGLDTDRHLYGHVPGV